MRCAVLATVNRHQRLEEGLSEMVEYFRLILVEKEIDRKHD